MKPVYFPFTYINDTVENRGREKRGDGENMGRRVIPLQIIS